MEINNRKRLMASRNIDALLENIATIIVEPSYDGGDVILEAHESYLKILNILNIPYSEDPYEESFTLEYDAIQKLSKLDVSEFKNGNIKYLDDLEKTTNPADSNIQNSQTEKKEQDPLTKLAVEYQQVKCQKLETKRQIQEISDGCERIYEDDCRIPCTKVGIECIHSEYHACEHCKMAIPLLKHKKKLERRMKLIQEKITKHYRNHHPILTSVNPTINEYGDEYLAQKRIIKTDKYTSTTVDSIKPYSQDRIKTSVDENLPSKSKEHN